MTISRTTTWIAILDGKQAYFYSKGPEHRLGSLNHTLMARPIRTDPSQGRRELGRVHDSSGEGRHIIEPHTSDRTLERRQFMRDVAEYLEESLKKEEYTRLVVAAPPKILGFLRKELSKPVKDAIAMELDKDFVQLTPMQIQEHLEKIVYI